MRTVDFDINGKKYPLCFSTRVLCNVTEKFGGLDKMSAAMVSEDLSVKLETMLWALGEMLKAGKKYCDLMGEKANDPPKSEDLADLFGIDDLKDISPKIYEAITSGTKREVEADPPKNA